jgi:hypothetical protein
MSYLGCVITFMPIFTLMAIPSTALSQERSPEHERLNYMLGEWTYADSYEIGTMTCEWLGNTFVVCDQVFTEPSGKVVPVLQVFGYDAGEEAYTMDTFWSHNGSSASAVGWVEESTWTYVWTHNPASVARVSWVVEDASSSMSIKWEYSRKGGPWQHASEATMTRVR